MKKIISILLIISMLFVTGCDINGQNSESNSDSKQQSQEPEVIDVFSMFEPYEVEPLKLGDDGKYEAEDYLDRYYAQNDYKVDDVVHNLKIGNRIFEDMRLWEKTVSVGGDIKYSYRSINSKDDVTVENKGRITIASGMKSSPLYSIDDSFQFTEESVVNLAKEAVKFYFSEIDFNNYNCSIRNPDDSDFGRNRYVVSFSTKTVGGIRLDGGITVWIETETGVEYIAYTPTLTNLSDHEINKDLIMAALKVIMKETGCNAIYNNPEEILKITVYDHKAYIVFTIVEKGDIFHSERVLVS